MFITTERPLNPGSLLVVELDVEACSMRVQGSAVWRRVQAEIGRLPGMGVRIDDPPLVYTEYVRHIP
jgi:hypothetical protein